jgi:hypothetical protein
VVRRTGPAAARGGSRSVGVDDALAAAGWEVARRTVLRTAGCADVRRLAATAPGVTLVRSATPSAEWLALLEPELDPDAVARILVRPSDVVFRDPSPAPTADPDALARPVPSSRPVASS